MQEGRYGNGYEQLLMFVQFIRSNVPIHVVARYTPNDGIRMDTFSIGTDWQEYSRGIQQSHLPGNVMHGLGAFNTSITSRSNASNLFIENYTYSD